MNTTLYQKPPEDSQNWTNLYLEPHDYRIYYVIINLPHQYGISAPESQTFLRAKGPQRGKNLNLRILSGTLFRVVGLALSKRIGESVNEVVIRLGRVIKRRAVYFRFITTCRKIHFPKIAI